MIYFLISLVLFVFIHVGVMVLYLNILGIKIKVVSFGIGPKLYQYKNLRINLLPVSGFIQFSDYEINNQDMDDGRYYYENQSKLTKIAIQLSGGITLFLIPVLVFGLNAVDVFLGSFTQVFSGATSPIGMAQHYIESAHQFILSHSFYAIFAMVVIKLSVINLLPIPGVNGFSVLMECVYLPFQIKEKLPVVLWVIGLLMLLSWVSALFVYIF